MIGSHESSTSDAPDGNQGFDEPLSNFDRLIKHLSSDSLAAKLVAVYAEPGDRTPVKAMREIISERLDELKSSYDTA